METKKDLIRCGSKFKLGFNHPYGETKKVHDVFIAPERNQSTIININILESPTTIKITRHMSTWTTAGP